MHLNAHAPASQATTGWRVDRAVRVVPDLDRAAERFKAAGFTVTPGSDIDGRGIKNALIPFEDGSYLEIIAPRDPAATRYLQQLNAEGKSDTATAGTDAFEKRLMLHLADGTGFKDFAITYPGLNLTAKQLDADRKGFILDGSIPVRWVYPDGIIAKWYVSVPNFTFASSVPFLITDDTSCDLRIPGGNATVHPNGAIGIRDLAIATRDPDAVITWYDSMIPSAPRSESGTGANYDLNGTFITVYGTDQDAPEGPDTIILVRDNSDLLSLHDMGLI